MMRCFFKWYTRYLVRGVPGQAPRGVIMSCDPNTIDSRQHGRVIMWWIVSILVVLCFIVPGGFITVFFGLLIFWPLLMLLYFVYPFIQQLRKLH